VHLGRGRQRLLCLWLETAVIDPVSGRVCHDGHVLHRTERLGDVPGLHCGDIFGSLADEAWLLIPSKMKKSEASRAAPGSQ